LLAGEKRKEPLPPISETVANINIDKYMLSGDFKKTAIRSKEAVIYSLEVC
jgi:hypothetical protein